MADEQTSPVTGMPPKDIPAFAQGPEPYSLGPDSQPNPSMPRGELSKYSFASPGIYPGTTRDYWVYVPRQYDPAQPACLMVFQDGALYLNEGCNAHFVLDNLIERGDMPVTIAVFVNPGDKGPGLPIYGGNDNRSVEYDSLGDRYARFLLEELLPEVEQRYSITRDPAGRAVVGVSSGGICAFNAAWERPDAFGKVITHCGSYTNIRGGHAIASMIRRAERKALRVFMQSGEHDLNIIFGCWPLANRDVAAALEYREYDYQFVFGEGYHSLKHGASILPDTLRWMWRDYPRYRPR